MPETFYEDLHEGAVFPFGTYQIGEAEIIEFAEQYDPQWFHTDPERATDSIYGGLIASGWHTASITMRLLVDGFLASAASLGSPGLDSLQWPAPVRPGDVLTGHAEIVEKPTDGKRPNRGIVRTEVTTTVEETPVLTMTANVMFGRRAE